jgi:hypothetical protein
MTPAERPNPDWAPPSNDTQFVANFCLPFLRNAQNADGGWGFQPESQSRVEPSCWAISALQSVGNAPQSREMVERGRRFLRAAQIADGSWVASAEQRAGCWVTSLACMVLASDPQAEQPVTAGLSWICNDWPRDSSPLRRLLGRFSRERKISAQNDSYRGWGWTPRTSSWVEPTSFALLALARTSEEALPKLRARRRELGRRMLYDRMCPGGGWNCGNPMVYGVAGEPLIVPTVWALLALRDEPGRSEFATSLDWLERNVENARGAGSLALARMCLEVCGRKWPATAAAPADYYSRNEFLRSIPVTAWICLAISKRQAWLVNCTREIC